MSTRIASSKRTSSISSTGAEGVPRSAASATTSGSNSGIWTCVGCGLENTAEHKVCSICLRSRPLPPHRSIPQVFKGMVFHFNGIIPRTLRHASHSVEWRMAEHHGAKISSTFDAEVVNILVYRPGYERSDKVRLCIENHWSTIPCLPITWMLECMLQGRRLHPNLFRLQFVPSVALPTTKGSVLPHHHHPFYVQNVGDYALFPSQLPENREHHAMEKKLAADAAAAASHNDGKSATGSAAGTSGAKAGEGLGGLPPPPLFTIPSLKMDVVSVFDCAAAAPGEAAAAENGNVGESGRRMSKTDPPLASPMVAADDNQKQNTLVDPTAPTSQNRVLFKGLTMVLSETMSADTNTVRALRSRGAGLVHLPADFNETLTPEGHPIFQTGAYYVFHHDDKKKNGMITAARSKASGLAPNIVFAESCYVEDCVMVGELVPLAAPYCPTAKLLKTLEKKWDKLVAGGSTVTPSSSTPSAA